MAPERKKIMGFSELFKLAERLVVAVEHSAGALQAIAMTMSQPIITGERVDVTRMPESFEGKTASEVQTAAQGANELPGPSTAIDREDIKKKLHDRGIQFKASARTESLQKLLADAIAKEGKAGQEEDPFGEKSQPQQEAAAEKVYTKDEARDALVSLSGLKGKDAALTILRQHGKSETLSGVDASYYKAVVEACEKAKVS